MQRAEKTLAAPSGGEVPVVLVVIATGLAVLVGSTGWEVAWLVALGVGALLRRFGQRLASTMGPAGADQGHGDGGVPGL